MTMWSGLVPNPFAAREPRTTRWALLAMLLSSAVIVVALVLGATQWWIESLDREYESAFMRATAEADMRLREVSR